MRLACHANLWALYWNAALPPGALADDYWMRITAKRDYLQEIYDTVMPNTGMLDHRAYRPEGRRRTHVYWMSPWPSAAGYQTLRSLRVAEFSRHLKRGNMSQVPLTVSRPTSSTPRLAMGNSISPFHTAMKPGCGYFFSRETDNHKKKIGIPPSDLVSWRSSVHTRPRARTA